MPSLPIMPHLRRYGGSKETVRRKTDEFNRKAAMVAKHINGLIANDPSSLQQYFFGSIASELDISVDVVREAISDGGYNGITIGVREEDRQKLSRYLKPSGV